MSLEGRFESISVSRRGFLLGAIVIGAKVVLEPVLEKAASATPLFQEPPSDYQTYLTYLRRQLLSINGQILKNPSLLNEAVPWIGELATRYFCKELGYPTDRFKNKVIFESDEEYLRSYIEANTCDGLAQDRGENTVGFSPFRGGNPHINVTKEVFKSPNYTDLLPFPAVGIFETVVHELHHFATPFNRFPEPVAIPGIDEDLKYFASKGAQLLRYINSDSTEANNNLGDTQRDQRCWLAIYNRLEEAIVLDSTWRMINPLGFSVRRSDGAEQLRLIYKENWIDPLFYGDHTPVRILQQSSKSLEIIDLMGQRMATRMDIFPYPADVTPSQAAAVYLENSFLPHN